MSKKAASGPAVGDERVVLHTNRGDLVIALYDAVAPKHAAQIKKLVRLGVYDSTLLFRVEPNFVIQITNAQNRKQPLTPEQHKAITHIPAELSKIKHRKGIVSMARDTDDLNSAETSFSFMLGRSPELDGKYTVIGEVEFGQPLLDQIAKEPRDYWNKPVKPILIERAEVNTGAELEKLKATGALKGILPPK
jgi:cyclophilin family peptidyl-prolyl cis-trans isomerase